MLTDTSRVLHAATGNKLTAKGWGQEAALRMLHNNLDPAVAEHPENLVVYGGTGKAARNWQSFDAIVKTLTNLKNDETMLVQSGKPVGVFQTNEWAPRVLLANSNLVGDWANWPEFRRLEQLGLTMYGQMTAGSWIYIGTQGILQGTYETFAAVANKRFNGTLQGTLTLTGGCGGMGGAQPLAVTMNGGVCLVVDIDKTRLEKRIQTRYLDEIADNLDDAVARCLKAKNAGTPLSVGVVGNAAQVFPQLLKMDVPIDIVTDQTSAHDPLTYVPIGIDFDQAESFAKDKPEEFSLRAKEAMAKHVEAMVGFMDKGAEVFDLEGRFLGITPLPNIELAAGDHYEFEFRMEGYRNEHVEGDVIANKTTTVEKVLSIYAPPIEDEEWVDNFGVTYQPADGYHISSGFIRKYQWGRFLRETGEKYPSQVVSHSERGVKRSIEILLSFVNDS